MPKLSFILIGALFECGWAYGFKHAASTHESLLTATRVIASFFIFMLAFKYIARRSYTSYTRGSARFYRFTLNDRRAKRGLGD